MAWPGASTVLGVTANTWGSCDRNKNMKVYCSYSKKNVKIDYGRWEHSVKKKNLFETNIDFSQTQRLKDISTLGFDGAVAGAGRFLCARPESR